jgi:hypothetical protein
MKLQTTIYIGLAYATLVVDAYLALALVASRAMRRQYMSHVLPFGSDGILDASPFVVLFVVSWTAVLAIGCLRTTSVKAESHVGSGVLWFMLVLAVIWVAFLIPLLIDFSWNLFVRGL